MPKSKNPAGKGGALKDSPDTLTSVQASDYIPKEAISSVSVYSGRTLIGFVIEFSKEIHCVDAQGQSLGYFPTQKAAIELLTAARSGEVQP